MDVFVRIGGRTLPHGEERTPTREVGKMRRTSLAIVVALLAAACGLGGQDGVRTRVPSASTAPSPTGSPSPGSVTLQLGNDRPTTPIEVKPPGELPENRIGTSYAGGGLWSYPGFDHLDRLLIDTANLPAKRVDTSLYELEPPIDWTVSEYRIPKKVDRLVHDLAENGVVVNYMLHFWDKAGHATGEALSTPRFKTKEQIRDFLDYVRFLVRHFRGRIPYYTIWSEPDNDGDPIKFIEPKDYIHLARRTIPVIRREDPRAKVVLAPVVLFYARDYLFTILRSDVISMFDVVSWHPLYDTAPDIRRFADYYYEYPSIVQQIKRTASAHGFRGEYWGTELSWCSIELVGEKAPGCWAVHTDIQSAKYYAQGIVTELGLDVGVGLGGWRPDAPWAYPTLRRLATIMAGATATAVTAEIEGEATDIVSFGFSLPNGDSLFALWTNGIAVDDDPGVAATLTFPGRPATSAVGIDVLEGLQQELIVQQMGGSLVVPDLLVKDYPIFVRLTG
jgi:hypothetical protein